MATLLSSLLVVKMNKPPTNGPHIQPNPLNDCAKLMRRSADSFSPSTVTYGLAAVSRQVSPHPITNRENRKKGKDMICSPGINSKAPIPYNISPVITPVRYP